MTDTQALIAADVPIAADLEQVAQRLEKDLGRVRTRLRSLVTPPNGKVRDPIRYSVEHTGRLLRPTLVLISSYLVEGDPAGATRADIIEAATIVEVLHVATLHHDDLIDHAQIRRGRPTANAKYGEPIALLVGDHLLASCMKSAASLGAPQLELMAETLTDACVGQLLETSQLFDPLRTEQDYLDAISGKTASLIRAAVTIGALQCDADEAARTTLAGFGHGLGMAFQIWDDILDLCSTGTGKETDKDLLNGVYTLPMIYAMADQPDRLRRILREPRQLSADQCAEILSIMDETGAIRRAADVAEQHLTDAVAAVRDHPAFADRAPVVGRYLVDLVGRLAGRHPALSSLSATFDPRAGHPHVAR
jgi:heptaprenyl diphosphate synthase